MSPSFSFQLGFGKVHLVHQGESTDYCINAFEFSGNDLEFQKSSQMAEEIQLRSESSCQTAGVLIILAPLPPYAENHRTFLISTNFGFLS
jgi:hypothetical protein